MTRIGRNGGRALLPFVILRIYKLMNTNKLKIWSSKDLGINPHSQLTYMKLLKSLKIVEEVPYLYNLKNYRKEIKGWRLCSN